MLINVVNSSILLKNINIIFFSPKIQIVKIVYIMCKNYIKDLFGITSDIWCVCVCVCVL